MSSFGDRVYVGDMKDGEPHGRGKMTYADGDVFAGMWKDGMRDGCGTYTRFDGCVYEGVWKDDKNYGPMKKTYNSNSAFWYVYEGDYTDKQFNDKRMMKNSRQQY